MGLVTVTCNNLILKRLVANFLRDSSHVYVKTKNSKKFFCFFNFRCNAETTTTTASWYQQTCNANLNSNNAWLLATITVRRWHLRTDDSPTAVTLTTRNVLGILKISLTKVAPTVIY